MEENFIEGKGFEKIDFSEKTLAKGEYENCTFTQCNFANVNLSQFTFVACQFKECDISLINTNGTAFREVQFKNCKLLGVHFENCNDFLFEVSFEDCQLNLSSFYKRSLKGAIFKNCSLQEVDFAETDMSQALLDNCDLTNAIFDQTNLSQANLKTSYNYTIDPETNAIKKAIFSREEVGGLLYKHDIIIK